MGERLDRSYYADPEAIFAPVLGRKFEYSIEVEDGFNLPAVLDIIRYIENPIALDMRETITRKCIVGKNITLYLKDGEEEKKLGSVIINDTKTPYDVFPVFKQHPMAVMLLMELCGAFVLKKSNPLLKE